MKISRVFLLFVIIAHCYGASSWIPREYHFVGALSLFLCTAILYGVMEELVERVRVRAARVDRIENTNHGTKRSH